LAGTGGSSWDRRNNKHEPDKEKAKKRLLLMWSSFSCGDVLKQQHPVVATVAAAAAAQWAVSVPQQGLYIGGGSGAVFMVRRATMNRQDSCKLSWCACELEAKELSLTGLLYCRESCAANAGTCCGSHQPECQADSVMVLPFGDVTD
jgi:hypothetical protein